MTDIRIKNLHKINSRGSNDLLQDFHASLMPYIIRRVDNCTTVVHSKVVTAAYPLRYMQVQEALNALRLQSQPFDEDRQRTARTVSIVLSGNLYHALMCQQRITIDPRKDVDDVVFTDEDYLSVIALSGHRYVFDIDGVAAWRVDDSWSYTDDGDDDEERTVGHILDDLDMALQMPQGLNACLSQRQTYVGVSPQTDTVDDSVLTALLNEYRSALIEMGNEVSARRVQITPVETSITGCEGPCAFIDPDTDLDDCITLDDTYLRVTKIDDLPFVVRRDALKKYQVQHIRNVLSENEYDGCGDTEVTVTDEFAL